MSAPWVSGHRAMTVKGWTKLSIDAVIGNVEDRLDHFARSHYYDAGERLHCLESYLQGLRDAKRLMRHLQAVAAGDGTGRCLTCGGPCPLNDAYCEEHYG
jgi:hypothetical protein